MKARIIRIGNSQGIRIPKPLLEQSGLGDEVELEVQPDQIIIRRAGRPRQGWTAAFQEMARQGDDALLEAEGVAGSSWDEVEWEW